MQCLSAWGQWALELLLCSASMLWGQWAVELLHGTATMPGRSGQWNSCHALPHCLGSVALSFLQCTATLPRGQGHWNSCNALPHCLGAAGSATRAIHSHTAWGQWAVELLSSTASLPLRGRCGVLSEMPECLPTDTGKLEGCVSKCAMCASVLLHSRTSAQLHLAGTPPPTPVPSQTGSTRPTTSCVPRCTIIALCVVPRCLLLCTAQHSMCPATLHLWAEGSGQWNSCNAMPHCLGAVRSGILAVHRLTALEQWAVQVLQYSASPPGGSGQWNSC